ncbi:uncharacterized protein V6R79_023223 [Siganus canaliculatus]
MKMAPTLALLILFQLLLCTTVTSKKVCGRPPITEGIDDLTLKRVYEVGEEVTLTCEQGYLPSTPNPRRITCTATGEWTQSDLTCSPKLCSIPRPLQPLAMGKTEAPFKSVLNYTCDEGYVMQGANESHCLHDGTWSNPPPLCKAVNCPLPKSRNDVRIVHDKPVIGTTVKFGQGWTYECNPPKAPSHERGTCRADGTATEPPECREVSCSIPTAIANGFITFAVMRQHGYKEKVKYACNENYVLDGEAEIQCQNTGNWSSQPVCRAPCKVGIKRGRIFYNARKLWIADLKPNRVLHGEHVAFYCLNREERCGYPVATTCNDGTLPIPECFVAKRCPTPDPIPNGEVYYEDIVYQSRINFTCYEGYILSGASTAECLANGTWNSEVPKCEAVTCGPAPIPQSGIVLYDQQITGNTTDYGTRVTYKCLPPFVVSGDAWAECTASGTWTTTPECKVVTCPPPKNINNGYKSTSDKRQYDYMETVNYGCSGDYVLEGSFQSVCQEDGTWSETPSCKAPCRVVLNRGRILYKGQRIWIGDFSPNRILHKEIISVYCLDKARNCGYAMPTQCINGKLQIPECYAVPSHLTYTFKADTLPSEITQC